MLYYKATAGCGLRGVGIFYARARRPVSLIRGRASRPSQLALALACGSRARDGPVTPEKSRHSAHVTECQDCSGPGADDLEPHGGGLVLCTAQIANSGWF